jgi:Methylamine utilisation protein MauE
VSVKPLLRPDPLVPSTGVGVIDPTISGPILAVAAGVLVVSGVAKMRRPVAAAEAIAAVGLPGGVVAVRGLAAAEILVGLACLISPNRIAAAALALLYLALAGFVIAAWRLPEPLASCGCMGGDSDPPPHPLHAAMDVVLAGAGVLAVAAPAAGVPELLIDAPALAVPLLAGLACGVALVRVALDTLPVAVLAYAPGGEA